MRTQNTSRKRLPIRSKVESRTRSFPCPDELWADVERFARARGLGSPAAAARLLLQSGLELEGSVSSDLEAARAWQIERSWAEVERMEAGDQSFVGWDEIETMIEDARKGIRERARGPRHAPRG